MVRYMFPLKKIKNKFFRILVKSSPANKIRIWALKRCNCKVGRDVYLGYDLIIIEDLDQANISMVIGDRVAISPRVTLIIHSYPNNSKIRHYISELKGKITMEKDSWVGTGVVIYPNITVGEGSIIASNAVVTKDVLPYTVVAGIPAKKIGIVDVPWRDKTPDNNLEQT